MDGVEDALLLIRTHTDALQRLSCPTVGADGAAVVPGHGWALGVRPPTPGADLSAHCFAVHRISSPFSFTQAVEALVGQNFSPLPHAPQAQPKKQEPRVLSLPKSSRCATHMVSYLHGRGIDYDVIDYCIQTGRLYESLLRSREVSFTFRGKTYQAEIAGADVFPQGFAAVASQIRDFQGVNMLCDIGNGTMNIMFINDRKPAADRMFTEKYGTHQCMLAVRENVMRTHHATVDDTIINRVLRFGTADIQEDYLTTIRETAAGYVREIFRILREHEYNPALMRLHVLGSGSCLIRNFGEYDADRVTIYDDICATAKGYEYLCEQALRRGVRE